MTMAIAAMMAAVAVPSMVDLVRSNRLSSTARQLDADLQLARREAIKRNARVLVCRVGSTPGACGSDTDPWASGWIVCYDLNSDNDCDATATGNPNPIRRRGAIDPSLTFTGPAGAVRFNANGSQGGVGGSLTFTTRGYWTGAKSYVETVTATGNLSFAAGS